MARTLTILTPENIPLELELAGLGRRAAALIVDLAILFALLILLWIFGAVLVAALNTVGQSSLGVAALLIATFLLFFGYFIFFEVAWNGQTPGKRTLGLRVIRDGGFPVDFFSVATRNLVRIADFLPTFFGLGAICAFCQPHYKRFGDLAAGTVVIHEIGADVLKKVPSARPEAAAYLDNTHLAQNVTDPLQALTTAELELFRRFVLRRWQMDPRDAERFAYRLIVPRVERLNLQFPPGQPARYADLVTVLVRVADAKEEALALKRRVS